MITHCRNSQCRATLRVPNRPRGACSVSAVRFGFLHSWSNFVRHFRSGNHRLYPDGCEIISDCGDAFSQWRSCAGDAFFSYCRPGQRISRFISDYTGITDQDVRDAPRPIEVLVQFSKFVGGSVIMAHNGHRFDIKFLEATCRRHRAPTRTVESIDSISLSKRLFGRPGEQVIHWTV